MVLIHLLKHEQVALPTDFYLIEDPLFTFR